MTDKECIKEIRAIYPKLNIVDNDIVFTEYSIQDRAAVTRGENVDFYISDDGSYIMAYNKSIKRCFTL
jgi:hypothetical protein